MKLLNRGIICLSIGTSLFAGSCADESPWGGSSATDGKIELNLRTDGEVVMGTRATDEDGKAMIPESSKFSVTLQKSDGSYNKSWQSLEAFNKEEGFPQGIYTISAFYGEKDTEGFEKPFYYGEGQVEVKLGQTSTQTLTAELSNSMLSIRYSDQLKEMFKNRYSASVQTEGHTPVVYAYNEDRPAYLYSGEANVFVTLTNDKNETVNLNTVTISLAPKHHYILTVGVKTGESGTQSLDVQITEDITISDPIDIVLSDELFSAPAPTVEAVNFVSGQENQIFDSFVNADSEPQLHVTALSGISSAVLTLTANTAVPVFGGTNYSVDLVKADVNEQAKLKEAKLNCYGFFDDSSDKMAVVNLQEYIKNLPEGTYTVSLVVTDKKGKTSETGDNMVVYKVTVLGLSYKLECVNKPYFMDETIEVEVTCNYDGLKDNFTFYATNKNGEIVPVNATFKSEKEGSDGNKIFTYSLAVDQIDNCEWTVRVKYNNKETLDINIDVIMPEFEVETDAFAKRVKLRLSNLSNTKALQLEDVLKILKVKNNGEDLDVTLDRSNSSENIIVVTGLDSKTSYSDMVLYLGKSTNNVYTGEKVSFITEEELDVPNGDFEELGKEYKVQDLNQGGAYRPSSSSVFRNDMQNKTSFDFFEPSLWTSNNSKTMSGSENTWYRIPSVFNTDLYYEGSCPGQLGGSAGAETGTPSSYKNFSAYKNSRGVVIRNVSWDPNGEKIDDDIPGIFNTKGTGDYYNFNVPNISYNSIGKLFLGNYNFSENDDLIEEGIDFQSRPTKIKGYYKYSSPDANEKGLIEIKIYSGQTKLIDKSLELDQVDEYTSFTIDLASDYSFTSSKANKLYIMVASSNYTDSNKVQVKTYNSKIESFKHGATLIVDDFEFVYE